ncbi:MAG: winged helix-turn-helix transcriptional regulator [Bacteroidetes bacterium]|nr:winged helix-turn-helix transcriptional regulator [Bacteroidota bacterium]
MGATKTDSFSDKQLKLAAISKAMGHPARIAILELLLKSPSCICGDIVEKLPLAQATVSQHLRELKEAGLIKGRISGTAICYCLEEKTLEDLSAFINRAMEKIDQIKSSCCS